jgi:N-hydroxyarylamine O-acetyltransferase
VLRSRNFIVAAVGAVAAPSRALRTWGCAPLWIALPRVFDLDAYVQRIGLSGRPPVAEIHRAHVTSIPFENLDSQRGLPVSLADEDLQRKLVAERRGGYCFEQNLLLKGALEALGAEVEPMLARVRWGAPPGTVRPAGHLVLRVRHEGATWLADVGFGAGAPFEPLPFVVGREQEQAGWRFRLAEDRDELVLQCAGSDGWSDLYGFVPTPVPIVDIEISNWWVCTHPRSPFVTGLLISTRDDRDGSWVSLSDWSGELALTERTPARTDVTAAAREEIPALLEERFGLRGFALARDGRVVEVRS